MKSNDSHELSFKQVCFSRKLKGGESVLVFDGLDFTAPEGSHIAVIGGSGVGKTTLLRLANRLDDPDSGRVLFGGACIDELDVIRHRAEVALVMQKPVTMAKTVLDETCFSDVLRNKKPNPDKAGLTLQIVGIGQELFDRAPGSLSIGQQQRVCLARALYAQPKVLMMDETTSSMDPQLAVKVLENLRKLSEQNSMTIIHVTHEMNKIKMADQVVLLDGGIAAEKAAPEKFLQSPQTISGKRFLGRL